MPICIFCASGFAWLGRVVKFFTIHQSPEIDTLQKSKKFPKTTNFYVQLGAP